MSTQVIQKTDIESKKSTVKKSVRFAKEQKEILQKLNTILGITSDNNMFYVCDMDKKEKEIVALKEDITKYYSCSKSRLFKHGNVAREHFALVKIVYKLNDIDLLYAKKTIVRDGKKVHATAYVVNI